MAYKGLRTHTAPIQVGPAKELQRNQAYHTNKCALAGVITNVKKLDRYRNALVAHSLIPFLHFAVVVVVACRSRKAIPREFENELF